MFFWKVSENIPGLLRVLNSFKKRYHCFPKADFFFFCSQIYNSLLDNIYITINGKCINKNMLLLLFRVLSPPPFFSPTVSHTEIASAFGYLLCIFLCLLT